MAEGYRTICSNIHRGYVAEHRDARGVIAVSNHAAGNVYRAANCYGIIEVIGLFERLRLFCDKIDTVCELRGQIPCL